MRFVSWNVNGIRAVLKKNFLEVFDAFDADIFAIQETVVVFDTPDQRVYAEELIDALGCGRAVQNTDGEYVYDGDFLILIGSDWQ